MSLDRKFLEAQMIYEKQIADLEAKLAESEEKYKKLGECYKNTARQDLEDKYRLADEIDQLKQQLAEKEEELKKFKSIGATPRQLQRAYQERYKYNERRLQLEEQLNSAKVGEEFALKCCDEANNLLALQVAGQNQDKISFCIEKLEKVKEFCNNPKNRVEYEYCPNAWTYAVDKDKLMLEIDNQIKQLKEME